MKAAFVEWSFPSLRFVFNIHSKRKRQLIYSILDCGDEDMKEHLNNSLMECYRMKWVGNMEPFTSDEVFDAFEYHLAYFKKGHVDHLDLRVPFRRSLALYYVLFHPCMKVQLKDFVNDNIPIGFDIEPFDEFDTEGLCRCVNNDLEPFAELYLRELSGTVAN